MPITTETRDRSRRDRARPSAGQCARQRRLERAARRDRAHGPTTPSVRCVLIRAEGRGFCAGVDIKEMQAHPERIVDAQPRQLPDLQGRARLRGAGDRRRARLRASAAASASAGAADIDHRRRRRVLRRCRRSIAARWAARRTCSACCRCTRCARCFFTGGNDPRRRGLPAGRGREGRAARKLLDEARAFAAKIAGEEPPALVLAKEALNGIEPRDVEHGYRCEQGFTLEMYMHADSPEGARRVRRTSGKAKF